MTNKKKLIVEIVLIGILVSVVHIIRSWRGNPPALEFEPAKIKGPVDAPISLVEFSDFACPSCRKVQPILQQYLDMYPDKIKLVFKHFPLQMNEINTFKAAEAAECAADQGKFWEYANLLFLNSWMWFEESPDAIKGFDLLAMKLGLDRNQFNACLESGKKREIVFRNREEGIGYLVKGTPTVLLNANKVLINPANMEMTKKEIEKALEDLN